MSRLQTVRRSALHACLERLEPIWDERGGIMCPLHFGDPDEEAAITSELALADRGSLPRMGLKGPDTMVWARAQGIPVPDTIYGWNRVADGALVVRVGAGELFLEGAHVAVAEAGLASVVSGTGCWPVQREDAAFLLCGVRAAEVLAQACSYDFHGAGGNFVMTRVALVSCAILVEEGKGEDKVEDVSGARVYHLWAPASYGPYLWDALLAIVSECGGSPVGELAVATVLSRR